MAWADQRAAQGLAERLPARPASVVDDVERAKSDPRSPYERVAVELLSRIDAGAIRPGDRFPTGKQLGIEFGVATATAQRAVTLLQTWGLVDVSRPTDRAKVVRYGCRLGAMPPAPLPDWASLFTEPRGFIGHR